MSRLHGANGIERTEQTIWVKIYASGPISVAKHILRRECLREGLCVAVEPTTFVYTGGEEEGYSVTFINYPRFPSTSEALWDRATSIAKMLLDETYQHSILVMSLNKTLWISKRQD